jgi:RNA polymerase sigma-32 factor
MTAQATDATRRLVERGLSDLSPRHRRVVEARRMRDVPVALSEVGRELGVSGERVRQLQIQAEDQLRSSCSEAVVQARA